MGLIKLPLIARRIVSLFRDLISDRRHLRKMINMFLKYMILMSSGKVKGE